ncbi:MAG: hypothetical protein R3B90_19210 [Planctomycetaceae bacterium]
MRLQWICLYGLLVGFVAQCDNVCRAEDQPVTGAEVRALLRRLEQAEQRIGDLQQELSATQRKPPLSRRAVQLRRRAFVRH